MAKKAANNKSAIKGQQPHKQDPVDSKPEQAKKGGSSILNSAYLPYLIISLFAISLFFNTLWNQYALDDVGMITQNKFTLKGFSGIKDHFTHDAAIGFFGEQGGKIMSGGRYRPLSLVSFAMEVQFFGLNPKVSHAVNILLFTLTCILLYHLLLYLLPKKKDTPFYLSLPFIATMLFAGHPIHTEVVANIKGRDEIMGLLFALLALYAAIKYVKSQNILHLIWGSVVFFLALLSKENAVTFFAIIPLTYYFFTQAKLKDYVLTIGLYLIPFIAFLYMRRIYTMADLSFESPEVLNNPFAFIPHTTDGLMQRYASIIMTFILYIKLLIFPHPLTHDYYYNQVPIVGLGDPMFLLSVLINGGLLIYALIGLRKRAIYSYAILFYFITFSIVSNLLFTVSMLLNERLIYASSVGFCILIAWLLIRAKDRYSLPVKAVTGIMVVILLLYSIKTISRNRVWQDNLTLFVTDAKTSANSAKVSLAASNETYDLANANLDSLRQLGQLQKITRLLDIDVDPQTAADSTIRNALLRKTIQYIKESLKIYPTRAASWLRLGNATYKLNKDVNEAIGYHKKAATLSGGEMYEPWYNMGIIEVNNKMPVQAKEHLIKALTIKPDEVSCRYYLAVAYMNLKMNDSALIWFKKTLDLKPTDAGLYHYIGTQCGSLGDLNMAIEYISKAIELDPNKKTFYLDLAIAYRAKNMPDDAIRVDQQCLQKFPNDIAAIKSIATSYGMKGDNQKAQEYMAQVAQLSGQKK